ncbi:hypothetical protein D3C84_611960 [compost metagenome]
MALILGGKPIGATQGVGHDSFANFLQVWRNLECRCSRNLSKRNAIGQGQLTHHPQIDQRQLAAYPAVDGQGGVYRVFALQVAAAVVALGLAPDAWAHHALAGQTARLPGLAIAPGVPRGNSIFRGDTCVHDGAARAAEQAALEHQRAVAATDIRVHAGQTDFLVIGCHAVEGEVPALFVARHQLQHLACTAGWQVEVDPGVVVVGRTEVALDRIDHGRHRIEQADKVDGHMYRPIKVLVDARGSRLEQLRQHATRWFQQFVGKMPGSSRATAEAKDVEFDAVDLQLGVAAQQALELFIDFRRALFDPRNDSGVAQSGALAVQRVGCAAAGADTFEVNRQVSCCGVML